MTEGTLEPPVDPRRDHLRGAADAPVTLVEYGDYECPHCAMARPVVEAIEREFAGRLRFTWRHFPRPEHAHAHMAAEAAEAAGVQDRYWQMHDMLLTHQVALAQPDLERYADEIGLNLEQFRRDLVARAAHDRVGEDLASALRNGARGTPTFFINGVLHRGRADVAELRAAILEALGTGAGQASP